jgi:MFS superfamily sulfate permease-like transporter
MHGVTKKKCTVKIVSNSKSISAPAYLGVWNYYKFTTPKSEKCFFFPDDIECCVKGSRRRWVDKFFVDQERPPIPPVWPVKIGTNLTHPEIVKLENAGFLLPQKERITSTRLFNISAPSLDLSGVDVIANPDSYHSSRQSKTTIRSATVPSTKQMQMVASTRAMDETILKVTMIPRPRFGCVLTLQSLQENRQTTTTLTTSNSVIKDYND